MPNVGTYEPCFPQRDTTIVGNLVFSNNNPGTDAIDSAQLAFGNGILLVGAVENTVERNQIWDHDITGIGVVPYPEDDPHAVSSKDLTACEGKPPAEVLDVRRREVPSTVLWPSTDNRVVGNAIADSRLADLGMNMVGHDADARRRELLLRQRGRDRVADRTCSRRRRAARRRSGDFAEGALDVAPLIAREKPPTVSYKDVALPDPGPQANMPNAAKAKARPAAARACVPRRRRDRVAAAPDVRDPAPGRGGPGARRRGASCGWSWRAVGDRRTDRGRRPGAAALPPGRPNSELSYDGALFAASCAFSHSADDDPIVFPGRPGLSHRHDFFGSTRTDADSTARVAAAAPGRPPATSRATPRRTGRRRCCATASRSPRSGPTRTTGSRPVCGPRAVEPYPPGLAMIAGDAHTDVPLPTAIVGWGCGRAPGGHEHASRTARASGRSTCG